MRYPVGTRTRLSLKVLRENSGQSLVEMALMLPVLFLMVFGFIYFCMVMFSLGNANFASRAALRYGSTHSSTSYVPATQTGFNNIVSPYIFQYPLNTWSVSTTYSRGANANLDNAVGNGVYVTFTISYIFNVLGHTYTPIAYSTTGCGIVLQ